MLVIYLVPSILTLKILYDNVAFLEQRYHCYCVSFFDFAVTLVT